MLRLLAAHSPKEKKKASALRKALIPLQKKKKKRKFRKNLASPQLDEGEKTSFLPQEKLAKFACQNDGKKKNAATVQKEKKQNDLLETKERVCPLLLHNKKREKKDILQLDLEPFRGGEIHFSHEKKGRAYLHLSVE